MKLLKVNKSIVLRLNPLVRKPSLYLNSAPSKSFFSRLDFLLDSDLKYRKCYIKLCIQQISGC